MTRREVTRRIHPAMLAASIIVLALALDAHAAWAQFGPLGGSTSTPIGGIAGWVLARQATFYLELAGMIRRGQG